MTALAIALLLAFVASNALWLRELRKQRDGAWTREQNLLNRIQAPEVFQPTFAGGEDELPVDPEGPQDEFDLVGTVQTRGADGD